MNPPVISMIYAILPFITQGKVTFDFYQSRRLMLLRFEGVKIALITATSAEEFEQCKAIIEERRQ